MIILAILKRDLRHLWPHILLFWVLLALSACLEPAYAHGLGSRDYERLVRYALILAGAVLIVEAVQQETLTGHRQYWLTRPLSGRQLALAKAAFMLVAIELPILAARCIFLVALGIPPGEYLLGLVWRELIFAAFYILPVAALAAVTRNLGQAALGALVIAVLASAVRCLVPEQPSPVADVGVPVTPDQIRALFAVVLLTAAGALWLQYARRRTFAASCVLLAGAVLWTLGLRLPWPAPPAPPNAAVSLDPFPAARTAPPGVIQVPIRIANIPPGVGIVATGSFSLTDASADRVGRVSAVFGPHSGGRGRLTVRANSDSPELNQALNQRLTLDLDLFTAEADLPFPGSAGVVVRGIGRCAPEYRREPNCYSPFPRLALAVVRAEQGLDWVVWAEASHSDPFANSAIFRWIEWYPDFYGSPGARLATYKIVGRRSATLDLPNLRLADYLVR